MANRNAKKTAIRPIYTDKHIVYACSVINSRSFALLWICLHQFLLACERGCVPRWKCVCLLYWKLYNFQLFHFALTRASGPFLGTFSQFFFLISVSLTFFMCFLFVVWPLRPPHRTISFYVQHEFRCLLELFLLFCFLCGCCLLPRRTIIELVLV